jgi:alkyl sulfatase BDS1-like metallo-beta-lactamase superfamily hydrolase
MSETRQAATQKQPENALIVKAGQGQQEAVDLGSGIFMSRGISNAYLVTTGEDSVMINTGIYWEADETARRFAAVSDKPITRIVFTQGHADHIGGWPRFGGTGVETIAQANHADVREYWTSLAPFYSARTGKLWSRDVKTDRSAVPTYPEPVVDTTFLDSHSFEVGGRRFELYATPGGETTDSLVAWLPADRVVFTGNLMGPLFGHIPNLYTVRGDKIRSARAYIHGVERVIALEPEVLITGHGDPVRGADEIRERLIQLRDTARYIRDRTIEGMNAGTSLWQLMRDITLPPEYDIPQGHGKLPWLVRAVWEENAGWFRYESTTELYDVPVADIGDELIELAGGPDVAAQRAQAHVQAGRPLHALHFTDLALHATPGHQPSLAAKLAALKALLDASGQENFSEVRWLESQIAEVEAELG